MKILDYHQTYTNINCLLTHLPLDKKVDTFDTFRCISMNENFCILIEISLMFVSKGSINNNLALV